MFGAISNFGAFPIKKQVGEQIEIYNRNLFCNITADLLSEKETGNEIYDVANYVQISSKKTPQKICMLCTSRGSTTEGLCFGFIGTMAVFRG